MVELFQNTAGSARLPVSTSGPGRPETWAFDLQAEMTAVPATNSATARITFFMFEPSFCFDLTFDLHHPETAVATSSTSSTLKVSNAASTKDTPPIRRA